MDLIGVPILATLVVPIVAIVIGAMRMRRLSWLHALPWGAGAAVHGALSPWQCGGEDSFPPVGFCRSPAGLGFSVDGGTDPLAQSLNMDVALLAALRLSALAIVAFVGVIVIGNALVSRRQRDSSPTD